MKRVLSITLAMVMLVCTLALTGCANDQEKIVGTWVCDFSLEEYYQSESQESPFGELPEGVDLGDLKFAIEVEFDEDGEFEFYINDESFDDLLDELIDIIVKTLENNFENEGLSNDEIEGYLQTMGYSSIKELVESMLEGEYAYMFADIKESFELKGEYKIEDGELFLKNDGDDYDDDEAIKYEFINKNKLELYDEDLTLTFNRK